VKEGESFDYSGFKRNMLKEIDNTEDKLMAVEWRL